MSPRVAIDKQKIEAFCRKWKITEFSLFGSVLTDEFRPDSDVDVLVVFAEDAGWSLFDLMDMREELQPIFGREVDLVEKRALRNPYRKRHILAHHEVLYAA
jgi:uncharacterized protein